jgi:alpha-beta hydrolase superfamily lysophospholipase
VKPLWFGPEERPLFGWLHVPADAQARGSVLLCPTLGIEAASSRYTYRTLADRLAAAGLVVLRFDYDGTGDSAGDGDDPDRVASWLGSIRAALELIRSLGTGRTSVVGMRIGATLAAESLSSEMALVDDLVLWDPCASGRSFLREQSALWAIALGARSHNDGSIETPGLVFQKETVADLSPLAIADGIGPLADGVLLLTRASRKGNRQMNERLEMPHVEHVEVTGQEELVDVEPGDSTVPDRTLEIITDWLSARAFDSSAVLIDGDAVGRSRATFGMSQGGIIHEYPVQLGQRNLFGIVTSQRPQDGLAGPPKGRATEETPSRDLPAIFFLNTSVIDHTGPGRVWLELGRRWARAGFRVVRFDLTGVGDSPKRIGEVSPILFAPDALDDVVGAVRAVLPDDSSNAVFVGLCSGAYHAVEGAMVLNVQCIYAINPGLTFKPPLMSGESVSESSPEMLETNRQVSGARRGWAARALPARDRLEVVFEHLPNFVWWMINRLTLESPPARLLSQVVDSGVDLFVLAGAAEARYLTRGENSTMKRIRRNPRFTMEVIPSLEHTLFDLESRERAFKVLTQDLFARFGVVDMDR